MIDQVSKAIDLIKKLDKPRQLEIAQLILDELKWDETFEHSQSELSKLAGEALEEYKSGNASDRDW